MDTPRDDQCPGSRSRSGHSGTESERARCQRRSRLVPGCAFLGGGRVKGLPFLSVTGICRNVTCSALATTTEPVLPPKLHPEEHGPALRDLHRVGAVQDHGGGVELAQRVGVEPRDVAVHQLGLVTRRADVGVAGGVVAQDPVHLHLVVAGRELGGEEVLSVRDRLQILAERVPPHRGLELLRALSADHVGVEMLDELAAVDDQRRGRLRRIQAQGWAAAQVLQRCGAHAAVGLADEERVTGGGVRRQVGAADQHGRGGQRSDGRADGWTAEHETSR
jgi:hypothetical protein